MTKLEEVARAIWEARRRYAQEAYGYELDEWGDGSVPTMNGIMGEARAAIAAMRGPTKEMALAWMGTTDYGDNKTLFAAKFNAMLDAVLAEDR